MESFLFIAISIVVAGVVLYINHLNRKCYVCDNKMASKRYLWFDPYQNRRIPICKDCFFENTHHSDLKGKNAN